MHKLLSITLVACILFSGLAFAAPTVPGAVYSDGVLGVGAHKPIQQVQQELQAAGVRDVRADDWFAGPVTILIQAGLLQPSSDGSFQPEATLSAVDGVAVFAKVLGIASKTDAPGVALAKAQQAGLISGSVDATTDFTRMDTAKLLAAALGVQPQPVYDLASYPFMDAEGLSPEDLGILKALYDLGIFRGYPEAGGKPSFRAANILTRAEIAALVDRILGAH